MNTHVLLALWQVFKGMKNDVQQVAIKVIDYTDALQRAEFAKVLFPLPRWSTFCLKAWQ